MLIQIVSYLL